MRAPLTHEAPASLGQALLTSLLPRTGRTLRSSLMLVKQCTKPYNDLYGEH